MMSFKFLSGRSPRKNCLPPSLSGWLSQVNKKWLFWGLPWLQLGRSNHRLNLTPSLQLYLTFGWNAALNFSNAGYFFRKTHGSKLLSFAPESSFCPCLIYSLEASISNRFLISDPLSSSCLPLLSSAALMPTLKYWKSFQFFATENWNQFNLVGSQFYSWVWIFLDST